MKFSRPPKLMLASILSVRRVALATLFAISVGCWTGYADPDHPPRSQARKPRPTCANLRDFVGTLPTRPDIDVLCFGYVALGDLYLCTARLFERYAADLRWKLDVAIAGCAR